MQAPDVNHLFQSDSDLARQRAREAKHNYDAGAAIRLSTKVLCMRVVEGGAYAYVGESGFVAKKVNLTVSCLSSDRTQRCCEVGSVALIFDLYSQERRLKYSKAIWGPLLRWLFTLREKATRYSLRARGTRLSRHGISGYRLSQLYFSVRMNRPSCSLPSDVRLPSNSDFTHRLCQISPRRLHHEFTLFWFL